MRYAAAHLAAAALAIITLRPAHGQAAELQPTDANLLANPGFEAGLAGWYYREDRAGVVEPSGTSHDGAAGLLLTVPGTIPGAAVVWQEVRGLSRGGRYCLSAWFLAVAEGGGFGLAVDEPERRLTDTLVYGQPSGWTWARICFQVETRRVRVTIWPSPGIVAGGGWVDSLALVPAPAQ